MPVRGYLAGYLGLGLAALQAQIPLEIKDCRPDPQKLSSGHMRILDLIFDDGIENVTKWHYNLFPGLIVGAFCTICRT